jgi:hypothetical protein
MAEFARWAHHNPTTTAWRSTAVDGGLRRSMTSKSRLDSVYGALWWLTVGFRTDLKIMVPPVRIRVPPLKKVLQIIEKSRGSGDKPEPIYCNRVLTECFIHRSCYRVAQAG